MNGEEKTERIKLYKEERRRRENVCSKVKKENRSEDVGRK